MLSNSNNHNYIQNVLTIAASTSKLDQKPVMYEERWVISEKVSGYQYVRWNDV